MGANVWPVDAVTGAPSYTGRMLRQLVGLTWGRNPARPLGARSGIAAGTPTTIATCPTTTTYQVTPFGGVIDGETSAVAGPYNFSFDSNQSGSVNASHATLDRIDLLYVRVSDPAEGDGSSVPVIELLYLAGTAASTPVPPATPARSMPMWNILVPHAGGAPVVSFAGTWAVGVGGIKPVPNSGGYPSGPFNGEAVYDQALDAVMIWNGSLWAPPQTGFTICVDTYSITPVANADTTHAVLFSTGTFLTGNGFTSTPTVMVTPNTATTGSTTMNWAVSGASSTGFTGHINRSTTTATGFSYIAIGT